MRYLSVCSGIEAVSVAVEPLGWDPVAFSEIAAFPAAVLQHHYPHVPNLGDMTSYQDWQINEPIDVLAGGTPCQSFSLAGLRDGLADSRGNLALTYCRILQKYQPRWFLFENVPGLRSSWTDETESPAEETDNTEDIWQSSDFATLLCAFRECGYSIASRILDAQFFGVPQRRRRIFVVGYLGTDWRRAAEVLFEPGCLSGDFETGGKTQQDVTGPLAARTSAGGGLGTDFDLDGGVTLAHSLTSSVGGPSGKEQQATFIDAAGRPLNGLESKVVTTPLTTRPFADGVAQENRLIATSTGDTSHCLNAGGMGRQDLETETMIACTLPASDGGVGNGMHPVIAISGRDRGDDGRGYEREPHFRLDIAGTVDTVKPERIAGPSIGVRRLTPRECERLQGFPDDWTLIPYRGGMAKDGPRYKAIGNSMAVPVVRWICRRIQAVDATSQTGQT